MSVTMHLEKPLKGIIPKAGPYWLKTKEERETVDLQFHECSEKEADRFWNDMYKTTYSDGMSHDLHDMSYIRVKYKGVKPYRNKRVRNYQVRKRELFKDYLIPAYKSSAGSTYPVLVTDEICYNQGWMFNKKFFNRTETYFEAYTKEEMLKLMDRYLQSNIIIDDGCVKTEGAKAYLDPYNHGHVIYRKTTYYDIEKIKQKFIDAWDKSGRENLIFIISF